MILVSQSSTTLLHLHRVSLPSKHSSSFAIKTTGKVKAAVISREDDLLSFTNGNAPFQMNLSLMIGPKKKKRLILFHLEHLLQIQLLHQPMVLLLKMMTLSWIYLLQVSLLSLRPLKIYAKESL